LGVATATPKRKTLQEFFWGLAFDTWRLSHGTAKGFYVLLSRLFWS
jgi:hypothetical protein